MKPRLSKSAIQLREQIDDAFPGRDRTSDGWIGDTRHAARKSDHNPRFDSLESLAIKESLTSSLTERSHRLERLGVGVLMMGSISIAITHMSALLQRAMKTLLGSISR